MTQNVAIRFTFGLKTDIVYVLCLLETYLDSTIDFWPASGFRWSSYSHIFTIIFSLLFRFFSEFFLFLFRKDLWVWFSVEFKVFCPFWCLFSRSDSHTPGNYLRSHLGLRSTKILLWAVTLQIWREIGQIENQVPKREKNPKKIEKKRQKFDTTKIARRQIDASQKSIFEIRYFSSDLES